MEYGPATIRLVPIALRRDVTVHIGNLPLDLTEAEARKIGAVVLAYAMPVEPMQKAAP